MLNLPLLTGCQAQVTCARRRESPGLGTSQLLAGAFLSSEPAAPETGVAPQLNSCHRNVSSSEGHHSQACPPMAGTQLSLVPFSCLLTKVGDPAEVKAI